MAKRKPDVVTYEFQTFGAAQDFSCSVDEADAEAPVVDYDIVAQRDAYKPETPMHAALAQFFTCRVAVKFAPAATTHERRAVAARATNRGGRKAGA